MRDPLRLRDHRRKPVLENVLAELAADLATGTGTPPAACSAPRHPTVFVVGSPRAGTTLCYQWLAASGAFTYPTNFVSRFPTAPWVGERIQRLLTDPDCDHGGELSGGLEVDPAPYTSRLGKTRGLLAPHEYWYWWRRFLPENRTQLFTNDQLAAVDTERLTIELAAWEHVRDLPLLMKGLIFEWNLPWLARVLPQAFFVFVRRDPFFVMQSLLGARQDFYGDEKVWYSFRPPEYGHLWDRSPEEQVAGQVHATETAVTAGLAAIDPARSLEITYEDLCADPAGTHVRLVAGLRGLDYELPAVYDGPDRFPASARIRVSAERAEALRQAWAQVSQGTPVPANSTN